ncbi:hypothetical protein [Streptomyces decoyicus]
MADHTPLPGPEARLLMLTLRTAHTGTGNPVGQDLTAPGLTDPERLVEQLTGCGWLGLPGTAGDLIASRPENPTPGCGDQNSRQRRLPWKHGKTVPSLYEEGTVVRAPGRPCTCISHRLVDVFPWTTDARFRPEGRSCVMIILHRCASGENPPTVRAGQVRGLLITADRP